MTPAIVSTLAIAFMVFLLYFISSSIIKEERRLRKLYEEYACVGPWQPYVQYDKKSECWGWGVGLGDGKPEFTDYRKSSTEEGATFKA